MKSGTMVYWRNYFRTANSDIFTIIDHAIMVAASDCPQEFRLRRDRIAERLFSCRLTRCSGCDRVELAVPGDGEEEDEDGGCKSGFHRDGREFEPGGSKESKVNSSPDEQGEMNMNQMSDYGYGDAEALTDEIEEQSQIFEEVLRIKEVIQNGEEESDSTLFESLRRLELMALTVDTLKATEIGKAVNLLRKHGSKQIRQLARTLIEGWKELVDEWVNATEEIKVSGSTPDSIDPSVVEDEEEGLPSPPLDECAFFTTQPTSMELSQFFEGMDDDGNLPSGGEFIKSSDHVRKLTIENRKDVNKSHDRVRKPTVENQNLVRRKPQTHNDTTTLANDFKSSQMKKQEAVVRPNKPPTTDSGPGRPPKLGAERKANIEQKSQQKPDKIAILKRQIINPQDRLKCSDEVAVQVKLEATKRKLQESYQQAENAKKQRTIQVMDLHDLPRQGPGQKNAHMKPGFHNRHWGHGRR